MCDCSKMANALAALDQDKKSRQRVITPHEQARIFGGTDKDRGVVC